MCPSVSLLVFFKRILRASHDSMITNQLCLCPAAKTDAAFKAFLDERNPKQQHSSTLESYLIKPIQRVLKYPLLLRELHSLTDPDSEEHYHLDGETLTSVITVVLLKP